MGLLYPSYADTAFNVQAALQPVEGATVAPRPLDAGSNGDRRQARRRYPLRDPPRGLAGKPVAGLVPGHRPERVPQLRMGRDHTGAGPLPFLTVMAGAAAKFRSCHG